LGKGVNVWEPEAVTLCPLVGIVWLAANAGAEATAVTASTAASLK
jgi:hypothetical protein